MDSNDLLHERYITTHPYSDADNIIKSSRNKRIKLLHTLRETLIAKKKDEYNKFIEIYINDKNDQNIKRDLNVRVISLPLNYFFKLLVIPEFLLGIKNTIAEELQMISNSVFFPRPSGKRLVVQINNFIVRAFDKSGIMRYNFYSDFCKGPTLLDVVEQNDKFYVCDVLYYNGILMASTPADCRLFFIKSRVQESPDSTFQSVDYYNTNSNDLLRIYEFIESSENVEYDSIIFLAKNAKYIGGYNPFWLIWRDSFISKYEEIGTPCRVYLDTKTGNLSTLDGVIIGNMDLNGIKNKKKKMIVKIIVSKVDLDNLRVLCYSIVTDKNNSMVVSAQGPLPHSMRQILSRFRFNGRILFHDLLNELEKINVIPMDNILL